MSLPARDAGNEGALGQKAWGQILIGQGVACDVLRTWLVCGLVTQAVGLGAQVSDGLGLLLGRKSHGLGLRKILHLPHFTCQTF